MVFPEPVSAREAVRDRPLHLAIGMFDGVHRGHQAVIRQVLAATGESELSGVLTFTPHPSRVLYPDRATALLMPLDQRVEKLLSLGVHRVFVQAFTRAYSTRDAADFVPFLLEVFPSLKSLHVGENFRFGSGRRGDTGVLQETARAMQVEVNVLERENLDGEPVSSSEIRRALAGGDMTRVNAMLGYPYTVSGEIIPGRKLGRGIGFPTLNVPWHPEAAPRFGVYRVIMRVGDSRELLQGIANYGLRPTVGNSRKPLLEVHLFETGGTPEIGDRVRVALLEFIRPEKVFPSIEALREQIRIDAEQVRKTPVPETVIQFENF